MRGFEFISYPSRETEWEQTCTLGKSIEEIDYIKKKNFLLYTKKTWLNSFSSWDFLLLFHMSELVLMQRKESAKNSLMNSHSTSSFRWWKTSFKIQKSCFPNGNAESRKPVMFSKVGLVYQSCLGMMIANFFSIDTGCSILVILFWLSFQSRTYWNAFNSVINQ